MSRGVRGALALAAIASVLAACALAPVAVAPAEPASAAVLVPLRNSGYEDAPRAGERCAPYWNCTMHADPDAFRFALESTAPAAGPWIQMHGVPAAQGHVERLVARTDGWQRVAVEFTVVPAATLLEVGAVLEGGGRACIDEARLEVLGPR